MAFEPFITTAAWSAAYPGAQAGVLVMRGAANPPRSPTLERRKLALEERLRQRYAGLDRAALAHSPVFQAYAAYYKRFKKTYHVQLQLESLVFKGKALPGGAALVEAMFMAELEHGLLTAGHDLANVALPASLDVAHGGETYLTLRGTPATLKSDDMFIADRLGIISDVLYGPDQRTQITANTRDVLFTVYAPPGIAPAAVEAHLETMADNVRAVAPEAAVELSKVFA